MWMGKGRIVVCDSGNKRASVFEKDGTFLFSFSNGNPFMVVVDSFGTIIAADYHKKSIELWK